KLIIVSLLTGVQNSVTDHLSPHNAYITFCPRVLQSNRMIERDDAVERELPLLVIDWTLS
ncbi:hypothetical protein BaRGS_00032624, partial [Batillaria attramentaria]